MTPQTLPTTHLLDSFLPHPDAGSRHAITIDAPAPLVLEVARTFDIESVRLVRMIFRLRVRLLRGHDDTPHEPTGLVDQMTALRAKGPGAIPKKAKGVNPVAAMTDPKVWELFRKLLAHKKLRDELTKLAEKYPDPAAEE